MSEKKVVTSETHSLKSKIDKWHEFELPVYEKVLELAKERFEDIMSESESMTNKSIKMASGILVFIGLFIGYAFSNPTIIAHHPSALGVTMLLILIESLLLVLLILPKKIINRGISPMSSIPDGIERETNKGYELQRFYYSVIATYQDNIDYMIDKNKTRSCIYTASLYGAAVLLIIIPVITVYIIS